MPEIWVWPLAQLAADNKAYHAALEEYRAETNDMRPTIELAPETRIKLLQRAIEIKQKEL